MFTIYNASRSDTTLVSHLFIDEYMKDANDAQLKVYLYLLRVMGAGASADISQMADLFNHTERDIVRSLDYWAGLGLLSLDHDEQGELTGIHLCDPRSGRNPVRSFRQDRPVIAVKEHTAPDRPRNDRNDSRTAGKKKQSPEVLEAFRSNQERAQLLFVIEQYIGKPLSVPEIESVYYISEDLGFSDALIDYLLQYCIDRGKKDFRYIEKVAVNWAENGITTPRQAERAVSPLARGSANRKGSRPAANRFNQFEQNQYDFDDLERQILGN